jgi:outer membrane lipoprotein-sorting protein
MQKSSNDKNMLTTAVHRRVLIALTFLMGVLSGCTALRTPPSREIPLLQEPRVFLQNILTEYAAREYFSALSRMKIASPSGALSLKGAVVVSSPSCLRVEMFAFLNQLAFLFATDSATMSVYLPAYNAIYTGKAANEHLAFLYGSDLPVQDAITLFLGFPHLSPYDASRVTWQYDNGCYLLELRSDGGYRQQVWVAPILNKIIKYMLYDAAGRAQYEFLFKDFRPAGAHTFPFTIDLMFHQSQTHIIISYSDIDSALPPEAGLFTLIPPVQTRRLPLEELSRSFIIKAD